MAFSAIAGLATAVIGASSARKSAKAQTNAANQQFELGQRQLDQTADFRAQDIRRSDQARQASEDTTKNLLRDGYDEAGKTFRNRRDTINDYQRNALRIENDRFDAREGVTDNLRRNLLRTADETADRRIGISRRGRNDAFDYADTRRDRQIGIANEATDDMMSVARQTRNAEVAQYQPYADSGQAAQAALSYELGVGARPEDYAGFDGTPGYAFRRDEAMRGVEGSAAARGGLYSGAAGREALRVASGLADQDYDNFMDRLSEQGAQGFDAATSIAGAEGAYGTARDNALRLQAAGQTGAWQTWGDARLNALGADTQARIGVVSDLGADRSGAYNTAAGADMNNINTFADGRGDVFRNAANQTMQNLTDRGTTRFNLLGTTAANNINSWNNWATMSADANAQAAQASNNATNFMGNALANRGDAQAAGAQGVGNALNRGFETFTGLEQFNNMGGWGTQGSPTSGWTNIFGGFFGPSANAAPAAAPGFNGGGGGFGGGAPNLNGLY